MWLHVSLHQNIKTETVVYKFIVVQYSSLKVFSMSFVYAIENRQIKKR